MAKEITIISMQDDRVKDRGNLKQLFNEHITKFKVCFIEDQFYAVLKKREEKYQTTEDVRMVAGDLSRQLKKYAFKQAHIEPKLLKEIWPDLEEGERVTAFVEGWELGAYSFDRYKSANKKTKTSLEFTDPSDIKSYVEQGKIRAQATAFSRDLMNEVPNALNPETFPQLLEETFANTDVQVTVFGEKDLEKMEMHGLLAVCRGSKHAPAFVELKYEGNPKKPLVALVGKGVTFDTGGISLKGSHDLSDMRMDMGGAAAVAGAIKLLAEAKADVNVVALLQIVENMPDNQSLLPGEVIQFKNGHKVQVANTDAEGRLILADGLIRAEELKADYIVNIATLTGAIVNALGTRIAGGFGDEGLLDVMKEIGQENGDFIWPMPLIDEYDETLKSDYADFCNISSKRSAGSITAALFLRRFVSNPKHWVHIDMAGFMESNSEKGYYAKSATGFGTRLLADFTEHVAKNC